MKKKNILMICLDGARVDMVNQSDRLKEIFSNGLFFNQCIVSSPYTIASINSIMTGMYGYKNGVDAYNNIPNTITLVPKIESINGIKNIDSITGALREKQRVVMLDHDDLFSNIISKSETVEYYIELIDNLVNYCKSESIMLLRTRGVIFSEEI